jgi:hypothetical protein
VSRRKFDRYMVAAGAGNHVKFARLTDSERCAHFLGVLSIAAQAPIRGCLLVGDQEADAIEIAHEARVSEKAAASALAKLKAVGVLEHDDELDCWRVHDWEDVNPPPKTDATNAERQARYRAKRAASNAARNATSNAVTNGTVTEMSTRAPDRVRAEPEGKEVEAEDPPNPPRGKRKKGPDIEERAVELGFDDWLADHAAVTGKTIPGRGTMTRTKLAGQYVACCKEVPAPALDSLKLATRAAHTDPHRLENGYDGAENVLRPTKVLGLFNNGRRLTPEPRGDGFGERLNAKAIR